MNNLKIKYIFPTFLLAFFASTSQATPTCMDLLVGTSESYVGLNISVGDQRGSAFLMNTASGNIRDLPLGWMVSNSPYTVSNSVWQQVSSRIDFDVPEFRSHKINYVNTKTGELLLSEPGEGEPKLVSGFGFRDELALVQTDQGSAILNKNGELTMLEWEVVWRYPNFSSGFTLALVTWDRPIPNQGPSPEGVMMSEKIFVDKNGNIHRPEVGMSLPLINLNQFTEEGLAAFAVSPSASNTSEWRWGYLNTELAVAIPPFYNKTLGFVGGYAWVWKDNEWGVIDTDGNHKEVGVLREPTPLTGTNLFYVVSQDFMKAFIYSNDGEVKFEIQPPENQSANLSESEPELPALTNQETFPFAVDYIGGDMINFKFGQKFYTYNIKEKKYIESLSGSFSISQPFTNGHAKFSLYALSDRGSYGVGEGYINLDGQIIAFTPHVGNIGLIVPEDGESTAGDLLPLLIDNRSRN